MSNEDLNGQNDNKEYRKRTQVLFSPFAIEQQATQDKNSNSNKKKQPTFDIETELSGQSLYKTELCRTYEETKICRYGTKCQFAHGIEELRPLTRHPKYKTEVCKTFSNTGSCPYGKRCRFLHTTNKLQNRSPNIPHTHYSQISNDSQISEALTINDINTKIKYLILNNSQIHPGIEQHHSLTHSNGTEIVEPGHNSEFVNTTEGEPVFDEEIELESQDNVRRLSFFQSLAEQP